MLSRLVVDIYTWVIEMALWCILVVAGVAGYKLTVPILTNGGLILENEWAWNIFGMLFFAVASFLMSAVIAGPILTLIDIRKSVNALVAANTGTISSGSARLPPTERREPSL